MTSATGTADLRTRFERECGARFFLDPDDPAAIDRHLRELGWLAGDRVLSAAKIGDGNMNLTVRIRTERRSAIVKQARPWVEKYPSIAAPVSRSAVEAAFYLAVMPEPAVSGRMPAFLGADPNAYLLILEDVPDSADLSVLYSGDRLTAEDCAELIEYLSALHSLDTSAVSSELFGNRDMRALNHTHQYDIPLRPSSGIDLDRVTPGLEALAREVVLDHAYCEQVHELGRIYLADGGTLLHGDYFPGSWLRTPLGLCVIDPEFCFLGPAEYDLGILVAHLILTSHNDLLPEMRTSYSGSPDWKLVDRFAGAELMRRLIGVAQLPLAAGLDQKRAWLGLSRRLVCG